ncbi:MAG TPA: 3-hydroxyacyl-CoA dehydrogenase NAD-binding domain-containing protein [Micromonosporaceae bacterium]
MIRWEQREDGIVVLTLDDPAQSANTINARYIEAMGATVDRLRAERDTITGVVITSGKPNGFLLGMDLKDFTAGAAGPFGDGAAGGGGASDGAAGGGGAAGSATDGASGVGAGATRPISRRVYELAGIVKDQFRRLETLGRPVVAAINGTALGGGFEVPLACHHRVVLDSPSIRLGLPEVTLGLLPGGGGVTRVVRLLGVQDALTKVLLQGQRLRPAQALEIGLVDELATTPEELIDKAVAWIAANPRAAQPWDRPGYRLPGGRPTDKAMAMALPAFPATLRKQLKGAHYPAPHAILCAAVEGAQVDIDTALRIEGRWFASLVDTPVQRNMTQAFFFDLQHLNRGGSRPAAEPSRVSKVGVIGAGMMGSGIAYACARRGIDVVLVDVSLTAAEKGRDYSRKLLDKAVSRGRSTAERRDATLARITPTDRIDDVAGCDMVIEAVFEDLALKHETYRKLAAVLDPDAVIASNTSSLPITSLAEALDRPERFLGLHFFSPVDKMPLVEIIRGKATSDQTLARGYDLVRQIDKTPIVVNDSRGFFTSRVFGAYILEGLAMLAEGVPAASVEQAALQAGYPVGPLAVVDEVTLTLPRKLRDEARRAGVRTPSHPGEAVLDVMVERYRRTGKAAGAGFYDYPGDGSPKRLWPGLAEAFGTPSGPPAVPMRDLRERLLVVEALEAVACLDEGVLEAVPDGNIGSIFGIGFPAWTGGVLQYVDQYPGGVAGFVARAEELAQRYGERFRPSATLRERAERGEPIRTR